MAGELDNLERLHAVIAEHPGHEQEIRCSVLGWIISNADPDDVDAAIANALGYLPDRTVA